jgi:hypothetical protein
MSNGRISRKAMMTGCLILFGIWVLWWSSQYWWPVVAKGVGG